MLRRLDMLSDRLRRSAVALPVAVALAVITLVVSELTFRDADQRLRSTVDVGRVRVETLQIVRRLNEIEASQRGFLLTGQPDYLVPFDGAVKELRESQARLNLLLQQADVREALPYRDRLLELTEAKVSEVQEVLRLQQAGEGARALELVRSGLGRDAMAQVQTQVSQLIDTLNSRIGNMLGRIYGTLLAGRIGVAGLVAASLVAMALFLRVAWRYDRAREEQQQLLQHEKQRLADEVAQRTAELTELARHLETAREDERARIARDLHDELGALLTAAKLDVARIRPSLQRDAPDSLPRLAHLTEQLNAVISLKRRIIEDLRPSTLENLGLQAALEVLCEEFGERMALPVRLTITPVHLTNSAELTAFRVVQESLNNIAKHAQAHEVQVVVEPVGDEARVMVQDDGVGFDLAAVPSARHGLLGMRYRVAAEQGRLQVSSMPGSGTRLVAHLPQQALALPPPDAGGPAPLTH